MFYAPCKMLYTSFEIKFVDTYVSPSYDHTRSHGTYVKNYSGYS